jgi:hypothetical protein
MSEALDRDKLLTAAAILSGDPALTRYGEYQLAQRRGRKSSIGSGFILDSHSGEVTRDPGYADYERGRDQLEAEQRTRLQQDMMDRLGYSADLRSRQPRYTSQETEGGVAPVQINPNAPGGARAEPTIPVRRPIADADRQKAAEAGRLAKEARELFAALQKTPGTVDSPKDIASEAIGKIPIVGRGASRAYTEGVFSPEQLSLKSRGDRYEQNLSNLAAGLALTGYELEQRDRWSPFARGISQKESQRRLENIERDFGTRQETILRANESGYHGQDGLSYEEWAQTENSQYPRIYERGSPEDVEALKRSERISPREEWIIDENGKPKRIR